MRWLRFRIEAPMASFGAEAIDARGKTNNFPTQSMLTGLLANAMGWSRAMREQHQSLQNRIVYGAMRVQEPTLGLLTDYQTARLDKGDRAWTTSGLPLGRDGGAATYQGSHQRWRDYHSDVCILGVLRLENEHLMPTLDDLAAALIHPARALFLGRKACLPSRQIFDGWVDNATDARTALLLIAPETNREFQALWPVAESVEGSNLQTSTTDQRNWLTGLHGGQRRVCEGSLVRMESTS